MVITVVSLGNCLVHIHGTELTLRSSPGKIAPAAVFVSGGSFGVKVESTSNLRNSTALTDWNYNSANWGYYYSHTLYEAPGNDGEVNIYFDDVRQMRGTQASTVGLFLKIKNFGDVKEVVYSN